MGADMNDERAQQAWDDTMHTIHTWTPIIEHRVEWGVHPDATVAEVVCFTRAVADMYAMLSHELNDVADRHDARS